MGIYSDTTNSKVRPTVTLGLPPPAHAIVLVGKGSLSLKSVRDLARSVVPST